MKMRKSIIIAVSIIAWTVILVAVVPFLVYCATDTTEEEKSLNEDRLLRNENLVAVQGDDGKVSIKNTETGRTTIHNIDLDWTQECGEDSLAVFCSNDRRGYYNMYTGEIAIKAQYRRAWVFSEGVAGVERNGMVGFIDHSGKTVIDFVYPYHGNSLSSFVFKHGHCVVADTKGKCGVIDLKGNWVIQPEYDSVTAFETYVLVGRRGLKMQMDYEGRILNSFIVDDIRTLTYRTVERIRDDSYSPEEQMVTVEKETGLLKYRVGNRSGLMDGSCHRITEPIYLDIEAMNATVFKATLPDGYSMVAIDRNGNLMR